MSEPSRVSNVNYAPGTIDPNVAIVPIGEDGKICYVNSIHASVDVIADHLGTISATAYQPAIQSGAPNRRIDTRNHATPRGYSPSEWPPTIGREWLFAFECPVGQTPSAGMVRQHPAGGQVQRLVFEDSRPPMIGTARDGWFSTSFIIDIPDDPDLIGNWTLELRCGARVDTPASNEHPTQETQISVSNRT
ncbi:MAG TPA: hypothetical protein VNQ73_00585 [Ilumatobacter sp.]|nr:hypothetical protein [Ilumatobacter sp.]